MKIKLNLILLFLVISLIPIILISIIYINSSSDILKESIGTNFERISKEKANLIDTLLRDRVVEAKLLAEMSEIKSILKESNSVYEGKSDKTILKEIKEIDEKWIESKETNENANKILNNKLSTYLKQYRDKNLDKYGEIFISDKKGAAVAMTKILSDYYQSDEEWWVKSFNNGEGDVFIDDRGFDDSINALAVGIVVPVKEDNEIIGILKINYRVTEILSVVEKQIGETGYDFLMRSQGDVIVVTKNKDIETVGLEQSILEKKDSGFENKHKNEIIGYSPIETTIYTRIPNPNEIKGISGETWELTTWFIVTGMESSEALSPIHELTKFILFISLIISVLVVVIAFFSARSISKPLEKLTKGTQIVSEGNLKHKIDIKIKNEIGELANAFNQMAFKLNNHEKITQKEIADKTKQLKNFNVILEKKVKDRTKELQKAKKELETKVQDRTRYISEKSEELKKSKKELEKKNVELEETLTDFYTMRIGMARDMEKGTVEKENKELKRRLDKLKKK
jgi:methyl-accepting chemotaxis protein